MKQAYLQARYLVVTEAQRGQRIDNSLRRWLADIPRSRLYRMIRKGEVRVNQKRVSAYYRLALGDSVRIPPVWESPEVEAPRPLSPKRLKQLSDAILYEDQHLIVINKAAGWASHGGSGIAWGVIEMMRHLRAQAPFLALVHRLDKDTSGCLMLAKKRSLLCHLHECLREKTLEKRYLALVEGPWKGGEIVEAALEKYILPSGEKRAKVSWSGKVAKTKFTVLQSYPTATLLRAEPITGRTHQIRVHCAFSGSPIVGDDKYGHSSQKSDLPGRTFSRLFLHAHQLVVRLPYAPYRLEVTSPLPKACETWLAHLNEHNN